MYQQLKKQPENWPVCCLLAGRGLKREFCGGPGEFQRVPLLALLPLRGGWDRGAVNKET